MKARLEPPFGPGRLDFSMHRRALRKQANTAGRDVSSGEMKKLRQRREGACGNHLRIEWFYLFDTPSHHIHGDPAFARDLARNAALRMSLSTRTTRSKWRFIRGDDRNNGTRKASP